MIFSVGCHVCNICLAENPSNQSTSLSLLPPVDFLNVILMLNLFVSAPISHFISQDFFWREFSAFLNDAVGEVETFEVSR